MKSLLKFTQRLFSRPLHSWKWIRKNTPDLNLVHIFTNEGIKYYKFPKESNLPLERFAMVMALLERLSSGLSGSEMDTILNEMEKDVAAGLSNPKTAARVAMYIHIMRERQSTVIHRDILLNLASTFIIREGEDPYTINPDTHKQKLETFESMCNGGAHDFFTKAGIEPLRPLMSMSPEDMQKLWEHNIQLQRQFHDSVTLLSTHRVSEQKGQRSK
jgi:hypothetical protein